MISWGSVNRKKSFAVFFALTGILINCYCQNWDPKELEDKIDSYIIPLADSQSFMGSILIAEKDSIVFLKSFGYANLEHLVPNSSSTVYRIGSMTKSFTATAIMLLIDKNKISVESKLSDFISDYPNGNRITIHQLLTHTSGIPDYTKLQDIESKKCLPVTLTELINRIKNLPLEFEPGSKFKYNNSGYLLLTYIIEKISGLSYSEFLDVNIFQPLDMNNTGYNNNKEIIKNHASGYSVLKGDNKIINADYVNMSVPQGAGGLHSTVLDLYKWDRSFYTNKLLTQEGKEKMFTFYISDYGYGWGREIRKNNRISIGHNGMISGFSSIIHRFVDDNTVIIILANTDNVAVNQVFNQIPAIYFREDE